MRQAAARVAIACALLIALVAASWFILSTVGREFLRHALEEQLSDLMEGEVQITEIGLDGKATIELKNMPAEGEDYIPTETRLTGLRVSDTGPPKRQVASPPPN